MNIKQEWKPLGSKHTLIISKKVQATSSSISGASTSDNNSKCSMCKNGVHPLYRCWTFTKLPIQVRREYTKTNKLCFSCLSSKHMINECQSKHTCKKCNKRHHTTLHADESSVSIACSNLATETEIRESPPKFEGTSCSNNTVLLGTAIVRVRDQCGTYHNVRILLDNGSQVLAVTTECASRIGLVSRKCRTDIVRHSQFGTKSHESERYHRV